MSRLRPGGGATWARGGGGHASSLPLCRTEGPPYLLEAGCPHRQEKVRLWPGRASRSFQSTLFSSSIVCLSAWDDLPPPTCLRGWPRGTRGLQHGHCARSLCPMARGPRSPRTAPPAACPPRLAHTLPAAAVRKAPPVASPCPCGGAPALSHLPQGAQAPTSPTSRPGGRGAHKRL